MLLVLSLLNLVTIMLRTIDDGAYLIIKDRFGKRFLPTEYEEDLARVEGIQIPIREQLHAFYAASCLLHPHRSINQLTFQGRFGNGEENVFKVSKASLVAGARAFFRKLIICTVAAKKAAFGREEEAAARERRRETAARKIEPGMWSR